MKTTELQTILKENEQKKVEFFLHGQEKITGDLHITEVKRVAIESMDCGSHDHKYKEAHIQLWIDEESGRTSEWTADKMYGILEKAGLFKSKNEDHEVFFEYSDRRTPTGKFHISDLEISESGIDLHLNIKPTECKPRANAAYACC